MVIQGYGWLLAVINGSEWLLLVVNYHRVQHMNVINGCHLINSCLLIGEKLTSHKSGRPW